MIRVQHLGAVSLILLDRPDHRNALTVQMLDQLAEVPATLPSQARCILLAGEGPVFCSGFDLDLCRNHPDGSALRALLNGLFRAVSTLREQPLPVVAAVQGAAIAGGCALLGAADLVLTHADAFFGYPVVLMGISPAVSAPFLSDSIGSAAARERLLDSAHISARQALRLGLAHECLDSPDQVRPRALAVANQLTAKPAGALRATRSWLRELEDAARPIPAGRGLDVSLSLTGGSEEQDRLNAPKARTPHPLR